MDINLFLKFSGNSCHVLENFPLLGFNVKIQQKSFDTSTLIIYFFLLKLNNLHLSYPLKLVKFQLERD